MDSLNSGSDIRTRAVAAVDGKIDRFFSRHILPVLEPSRIRWWFSLSGGKDSFSMAHGVRRWYERMGAECTASCFIIDQWGGSAAESLTKQLNWHTPLIVVDGRTATQEATNYLAGQQAPCRSCSDARHDLTDALMARNRVRRGAGSIDVVARGLHLTDTSVSLLWRHALGLKAAEEMISSGKAKPLVKLPGGHYLAKPLTYVREFESAAYADAHGYSPACCGCPACRFPSRRDIVEESLCRFMEGPLWEFAVPGARDFLEHLAADDVEPISVGGHLSKHRHLPDAFVTFSVERFRRLAAESRATWAAQCDPSIDLDSIGAAQLKGDIMPTLGDRVPMPALLAGRALQEREEWMIATMGPFWGAIGLPPALASKAWTLQKMCFGLSNDERWSQVNGLLHQFYSRGALPKSEYVIALRRLTRKQGAASHAI